LNVAEYRLILVTVALHSIFQFVGITVVQSHALLTTVSSYNMGSPGPIPPADHRQSMRHSPHPQEQSLPTQSSRRSFNNRRQHFRLLHLDTSAVANIRAIYPHQRMVGPMRKSHIPHRRWLLEFLLHTHRAHEPYCTWSYEVQEIDALQYVHHWVFPEYGYPYHHYDESEKYVCVCHLGTLFEEKC
jgi:hypothetical protein